jgi:hypothetical protein
LASLACSHYGIYIIDKNAPLKIDDLAGPRTSDALNRAMVGKWYDSYRMPVELNMGFLPLTATSDGLKAPAEVKIDDEGKVDVS